MRTYTVGEIKVHQFTWDILDSNTFVIDDNNSALFIDVVDTEELFEFARGFKDILILLTHAHYDHICGLNRLREVCNDTLVYASECCSNNIQDPRKNLSNIADPLMAFHEKKEVVKKRIKPFACKAAERTYTDLAEIEWKNHKIQMSEYHGHSADSSCIVIDEKFLFSGDTILPIPTVTRLPGGSTKKFWEEDIPRLMQMCNKIDMVFPGHKYPGNLAEMLAGNKMPLRSNSSKCL